MLRSTRRFLALLAGGAVLAGCGDQVTGPQATVDTRGPASTCDDDQPILYSMGSFLCGDGGGGDPLDPGNGGGGGGGGGGTQPEPFAPPPQPFEYDTSLPIYWGGSGGSWYSCGQTTKAFFGYGNDVTQGTTIYLSGITVPNTRVNWRIYDANGQLVISHLSQPSRSNCVVHHEPEGVSTWGLAPGYYYLYASYMGLQYYGVESASGYPTGIQGKYVGPLRVR